MAGMIRRLHRRKLARRALPESGLAVLNVQVADYRHLADEECTRFLQSILIINILVPGA
jgi:hypothetical protein